MTQQTALISVSVDGSRTTKSFVPNQNARHPHRERSASTDENLETEAIRNAKSSRAVHDRRDLTLHLAASERSARIRQSSLARSLAEWS